MSNDELLLQISEMIDKKLKPVNENINQAKEQIVQMRILMENDVLPRIQNIESFRESI